MKQSDKKHMQDTTKEWIDKKVYIKDKSGHPHAGETGVVVRGDIAKATNKFGLVVKGDVNEFFVFNTTLLQVLE